MDRAVLRLFLLIFLPALLLVAGAGSLLYCINLEKNRELAVANGVRAVEKAQRILAGELSVALKDLTYLAFVHESDEVFVDDINQDLKDTFMSIIYNRMDYDQIRYLDRSGAERFRINYNNGSPHVVRPADLQSKAHRPYFNDILSLDLDEIYISDMDLNIEHGEVEIPYKPTLRLGSPVWNPEGKTIGMLIINYRGASMLQALNELNMDTSGQVMLLNHDGYYLSGPGGEQEWSFMDAFETKPPAFAAAHEKAWEIIRAGARGQFTSEGGFFTFATMDLHRSIAEATKLHGAHKAPVWKVVSMVPSVTKSTEMVVLQGRIVLIGIVLLAAVAAVAWRFAGMRVQSRRAERMIMRQAESNKRFVPKEFLGLLHKGALMDVGLSDHVQSPMTTMFTDIRSYTKLSEGMSAPQVLDFLNAYYGVLDPIITDNHGFIDAFIGDAVMALFPDNAENAVQAAIGIRKALQQFEYAKNGIGPLQVRSGFGLHCGEVTLGAVGTAHRLQTTAIGDAVNLASRIESATKLYGVSIIISGAVRAAMPAPEKIHMRSIDLVRVKGKQEVVELFEVFDTDPDDLMQAKNDNLGMFSMAMASYRRGEFEKALELFSRIRESCPDDAVLDIFIKRSNTMMRIPPGDGWTGVSTL